MSRKNHRRNMNYPTNYAVKNAPVGDSLSASAIPSFPASGIQHQATPFFEQNPKGGLRVALTED